MRTVYFASVAHDLKTPVNSIMGTTRALVELLSSNP